MLTGKNPLSLPPYFDRPPVEYSARCLCGLHYLIFNHCSQAIGEAEARAKEQAEQMHARLVNLTADALVDYRSSLRACRKQMDAQDRKAFDRIFDTAHHPPPPA